MNTADLVVEYIVIGVVADIWLVLLLCAFCGPDAQTLHLVVDVLDKSSSLLVIPFLAITYILGGLVNLLASLSVKRLWQPRWNNYWFGSEAEYRKVKATIVQRASEEATLKLNSEGHLLRISRSNILNFLLLAIVSLSYVRVSSTIAISGAVISSLIAGLSYFQWKDHYDTNCRLMIGVSEVLCGRPEQEPTLANHPNSAPMTESKEV